MNKSPFENNGTKAAFLALFCLIASNYGLWSYIGMDEPTFRKAFELLCAVVTGLGITNNAYVGKWFGKEKK